MQKTRNHYHYMISYESKLCVKQNNCLTRPSGDAFAAPRATVHLSCDGSGGGGGGGASLSCMRGDQ